MSNTQFNSDNFENLTFVTFKGQKSKVPTLSEKHCIDNVHNNGASYMAFPSTKPQKVKQNR